MSASTAQLYLLCTQNKGPVDTRLSACTRLIADLALSNEQLSFAYTARAIVWRKLDENDKSVADLEHAIAVAPSNWTAQAVLNIYRGTDEDRTNARTALTHAINDETEDYSAYLYLAGIEAGERNYHEAIRLLNRAEKLEPDAAAIHAARAMAFAITKNERAAVRDLDRAFELRPDTARERHARGMMWNSLGQPEKAIPLFNDAIAAAPDNAELYLGRAVSYVLRKQNLLAERDARKAMELDRENAKALRLLQVLKVGENDGETTILIPGILLDPN